MWFQVSPFCFGSSIRLYHKVPPRQDLDCNSLCPTPADCLSAQHLPPLLPCLPILHCLIPQGSLSTCVWQAHKRTIKTVLWCQWLVSLCLFYLQFSWKSPQVQILPRLLVSSLLDRLLSSLKHRSTCGCPGQSSAPQEAAHCPLSTAKPWWDRWWVLQMKGIIWPLLVKLS